MRLLYLSCHQVLEHDEISMFSELGAEVFSIGAYLDPTHPIGANLRSALPELNRDPEDLAAFHALGCEEIAPQLRLTRDFVRRFDAAIVMHEPVWVEKNWGSLSGLPVIWRTIGQSNGQSEQQMARWRSAGLKIVRYSPNERHLANYCGEDAMIRFAMPKEMVGPWVGNNPRVVNFTQSLGKRAVPCGYETLRKTLSRFRHDICGGGNEGLPNASADPVSPGEMKRILRDRRVYFYTGTYPASYTLAFLEAWSCGIPIVAVGRRLWEIHPDRRGELYEVPDLITNGVDGFVSDDIEELQAHIRLLLRDHDLARRISAAAVKSARRRFDYATIRDRWGEFLERTVKRRAVAKANTVTTSAPGQVHSDLAEFADGSGWFDRRYRQDLGSRFPTFKLALNLFLRRGGHCIVETGCVRAEGDYGAGCSTILFSELLARYGGQLFSVDLDRDHIDVAERLTAHCRDSRALFHDDSLRFLTSTLPTAANFPGTIDLLYLDSLDYPLTEIQSELSAADLNGLSADKIAAALPHRVLPPQEHCLAELLAARPLLGENSIVMIDDNDLPGGGKSRLAKRFLHSDGWVCLLDLQQTLWVRASSLHQSAVDESPRSDGLMPTDGPLPTDRAFLSDRLGDATSISSGE